MPSIIWEDITPIGEHMQQLASKDMKNLYRKMFASLSGWEKVAVILRVLKAQSKHAWQQFFIEKFESIDKPLTQSEASILVNSLYKKVIKSFSYGEDADEAMGHIIQMILEQHWFENKAFKDKTQEDVIKLLRYFFYQQIDKLKSRKWQIEKKHEYYGITRPLQDYEEKSLSEELDARLQQPEEIFRTWKKNEDDINWKIMQRDFVKYLNSLNYKYPLDDIFLLSLDGYNLREIAESLEKEYGFEHINPQSIKNPLDTVYKELKTFLRPYRKPEVIENILDDIEEEVGTYAE
jgi:hypothetical protein